jgi:hypothetical protein
MWWHALSIRGCSPFLGPPRGPGACLTAPGVSPPFIRAPTIKKGPKIGMPGGPSPTERGNPSPLGGSELVCSQLIVLSLTDELFGCFAAMSATYTAILGRTAQNMLDAIVQAPLAGRMAARARWSRQLSVRRPSRPKGSFGSKPEPTGRARRRRRAQAIIVLAYPPSNP